MPIMCGIFSCVRITGANSIIVSTIRKMVTGSVTNAANIIGWNCAVVFGGLGGCYFLWASM